MTSRKLMRFSISSGAGLFVVLASFLFTFQVMGQQQEELVPLTMHLSSWVRSSDSPTADPREGQEELRTYAVRSDGSTVRIWHHRAADGAPYQVRQIEDLSAGRLTLVDESLGSITTRAISPTTVSSKKFLQTNVGGCAGEVSASVLGFDVISDVSERLPYKNGRMQIRQEVSVAPGLGCVVLESKTIVTREDGTDYVQARKVPIEVVRGEPDPALFEIPTIFTEMSPMDRLSAAYGGKDFSADPVAQLAEQDYQNRRVSD